MRTQSQLNFTNITTKTLFILNAISDIFSMLFFAVCLPVFKRFLGYISVAY